jgi:arylsulfatase A-like enzyme
MVQVIIRATLRSVTGLVLILLVGASFIGRANAQGSTSPETSPNILFLISDDHYYRALGAAGSPVIETPNLDRLAEEGVYFTHAYSPNPICITSRAVIFTGQDAWTNGTAILGEPIREDAPLWPRELADAGYETFFTGKWHNDGRPATRGFTDGAAIWRGGDYDHNNLPVVGYDESRDQRERVDQYSSTVFVDEAIKYLGDREGSQPFAMFVSFTVPHDPWMPPEEYQYMYEPEEISLPRNFMPRPPFETHESFPELRDQQQIPWPRPKWAIRGALTQYYAMITHMDEQIGRVLDHLDRLGLSENTLVIFVGDQGYSMGSHGFVGKQTMYEEGIRTPLILRYPQWERGGGRSHHLVSLTDLGPTILDAANVQVPGAMEGQSLHPLYSGQGGSFRDTVFASFHSPDYHHLSTRAIRTDRYKLIRHLLTGEAELFDLYTDPYELENLAGRAEYAELQRRLTERLEEWRSSHPEK